MIDILQFIGASAGKVGLLFMSLGFIARAGVGFLTDRWLMNAAVYALALCTFLAGVIAIARVYA